MVIAFWIPAQNTFIANATAEAERAEAFGRLWLLKGILGFPSPIVGGLLYDSFGFQAPLTASIIGITIDTVLIYFLIHDEP